MSERAEPILRMICIVLAAVLVYEVARVFIRHRPVGRLSVPALPTLPEKTNAVAETKGTNAAMAKADGKKGTNTVAEMTGMAGTNLVVTEGGGKKDKNANGVTVVALEKPETNAPAAGAEGGKTGTDAMATAHEHKKGTNAVAAAIEAELNGTNVVAAAGIEKKGTNNVSSQDFGKMGGHRNRTNEANGTNLMADIVKGTNPAKGTNGMVSAKGRTNGMPNMAAMGRRGRPGQMGGEKLPDLPPVVQARIDKIIQSEIMAQLSKPQPAALIGIAGNGAMLRAPSGQTQYVKEGGEVGGIKLVRIGINRVLVEQDGEKKELMIFEGEGGESLLSKPGETNDTKTPK